MRGYRWRPESPSGGERRRRRPWWDTGAGWRSVRNLWRMPARERVTGDRTMPRLTPRDPRASWPAGCFDKRHARSAAPTARVREARPVRPGPHGRGSHRDGGRADARRGWWRWCRCAGRVRRRRCSRARAADDWRCGSGTRRSSDPGGYCACHSRSRARFAFSLVGAVDVGRFAFRATAGAGGSCAGQRRRARSSAYVDEHGQCSGRSSGDRVDDAAGGGRDLPCG